MSESTNSNAAAAGAVASDKVLDAEEYAVKAQELESRLVRIEGRQNKEHAWADWFEQIDSPVTIAQIANKGLGMIARRDIQDNEVIMTCPPYACVPYEARKKVTCAHCMKDCSASSPSTATPTESLPPDYAPPAPPSTDADEQPLDSIGSNGEAPSASEIFAAIPMVICPACEEVWYCCERCREEDSSDHDGFECTALQAFDIPWAREYYGYCDDLITDIRLLIRTASRRRKQLAEGSDEFNEEYQLLISNRACYSEEVLNSLRGVVQYANFLLPSEVVMDEEELLDVYCKHRVNMFGLWGNNGECLGYGVYPRASYPCP